ncbi:MAG: hypothetical protein COA47_08860 [Robiginitomaculum sp.]|nr:MAG: hypothetical protein COA47_08860 [Robiginitomaculum sp.]
MTDRFENTHTGLDSPAAHAFAIVPDDANDLPEVTRALFVGIGGDITVITKSGSEVLFSGLASGDILPVRTLRIKATGTSAGNIVGLV